MQFPENNLAFFTAPLLFFYGFIIHLSLLFVKGFLKIYAINHIYSCSLYLVLLYFHTFTIIYEFCILISCIFLSRFLQIEINVNDTILIASKIKLPCIFSRAVIYTTYSLFCKFYLLFLNTRNILNDLPGNNKPHNRRDKSYRPGYHPLFAVLFLTVGGTVWHNGNFL